MTEQETVETIRRLEDERGRAYLPRIGTPWTG